MDTGAAAGCRVQDVGPGRVGVIGEPVGQTRGLRAHRGVRLAGDEQGVVLRGVVERCGTRRGLAEDQVGVGAADAERADSAEARVIAETTSISPTAITTSAMTLPSVMSLIVPLNWLRADSMGG